ncbi:NADP-dependent malic enzyme-like isoform X2 [Drosophila subobscura]|uniref:NADP-dependent malic enzyme-like isoform X2 n=1 Tax=Drosophila subobscura TaxID=7241 RepID=UPI00155B3BC8|nr:NADP-dependent malic enzyme-like isoform X2 [Drosophila subobscura]
MTFTKLRPLPRLASQLSAIGRSFLQVHNDARSHIVRPDWHSVTDGKLNKGLSFTIEERQRLGVHGLWPCSYRDLEEQLNAVWVNFQARRGNISKFTYINSLSHRHQRLYYRFLRDYTEIVLPIIYTPTVGEIVASFGLHFKYPDGLYITIFDRGHIRDVLENWKEKHVRAVCVTDGGRVLGLGDMGANGMGISIGKIALYTALAGVAPQQLLPVCLDVGTDNEELLADPLYVGARIKRVRGEEYEDFMQEFMEATVECFGGDTFIHHEDFATPNAIKFLEKYQYSFCCFNDDVQGTGATGLAGMLNVERVTKRKLEDMIFLFVGAGSAALGIANMLLTALQGRGLSLEAAASKIYLFDQNGLVTCGSEKIEEQARQFAKPMDPIKDLVAAVEQLKPSILLGATGVGGLFTEQVLRSLAKHQERPAVFALSNPTNKTECTAEQAYTFTEGRVLYCSGSPFPPVVFNGKRFTPAQANNCLVFPGIALGAICARARFLPDDIYAEVAATLAKSTSEERLAAGSLYPAIREAHNLALDVGVAVAKYLFENGLSNIYPVPKDVCAFIQKTQYRLEYQSALPPTWPYPDFPACRGKDCKAKNIL